MSAQGWQPQAFCLFVGYARSGHSAIGSVIDAHPHAVISHELNALKRYTEGITREQLWREIFDLSQQQARAGRVSSKAGGGTYRHDLPGQHKADLDGVRVIGDKKGAGTTVQIARHGGEVLEDFRRWLGVPLKILHVIRNPYDILSAELTLGRSSFGALLPHVAAVRERWLGDDWLDVYYEDVLADPARQIARILNFLQLPLLPGHLHACTEYLSRDPSRRRHQVDWPAGARALVERLCQRHAFLNRYTWHDD